MLNDNRKTTGLRDKKHGLNLKKSMPRLSLNLHIMPQTSDSHLEKWILWGVIIVLVFGIIAYLLFN